jgi:hypothetical protein
MAIVIVTRALGRYTKLQDVQWYLYVVWATVARQGGSGAVQGTIPQYSSGGGGKKQKKLVGYSNQAFIDYMYNALTISLWAPSSET